MEDHVRDSTTSRLFSFSLCSRISIQKAKKNLKLYCVVVRSFFVIEYDGVGPEGGLLLE